MPGFVIERVREQTFRDFLFLLERLAEYEHLNPPDIDAWERFKADMFGNPPKFEGYLGRLGEVSVGYVTFCFSYSTFLAKPTLFLEDIFVLEQHRGKGFGRLLFDFCRNEARIRGCGRMDWIVLEWNEPAIRFYEAIGAKRPGWQMFRLEQEEL
jgi:GNAT superfamily N-acetyltransferase